MRSIRMLAAVTSILALATACGDGGGGTPPPDNQAPVASFTEVCTGLSCVFTDTSADPDEGGTIASRSWNFGEPASTANTSTEQNPTHVYAAAGIYTVTLTVTDNEGANSTPFTKSVTVTAPPAENVPPTAAFTFTCDEAGACTFNSSTSTDSDGVIAGYAWNFGDPASGAANTSTEANPTHTYSVTQATPFTVTLTVTDDDGAASAAATQTVTIEPPPSLVCNATSPSPTDGRPRVLCNLDITNRSTLTVTMTSHDCELGGNKFEIIPRTLFFNGCSQVLEPAGKQYQVMDASGTTPRVFDAGTQAEARFTQGIPGAGSPPAGTPTIRLDGAWPTWTLNIDDGGNPGPGEPDFDDIVLTVTATRAQ